MKFDERHLTQVAMVVLCGGVTEAAAMLGTSQPAISRTIATLERRLGEPLFEKGRRPLRPTPLGSQLAAHGRAILEASRKASELIQGYRRGSFGVVRVGGVPYFVDAFVAAMIASFQKLEPDVRVDLSYGHVPELLAQLQADQIDMAIAPIGKVEPGQDVDFAAIFPGRHVVACRHGHPLLACKKLAAGHLMDFPWVAPLPGSPLMLDLYSILFTLGISELAIRYSGGSLMAVTQYVAHTDALAILPQSVVYALRDRNDVTFLPFDILQPLRVLGILTKASRPLNPAGYALRRRLLEAFEDVRVAIDGLERSTVWGR